MTIITGFALSFVVSLGCQERLVGTVENGEKVAPNEELQPRLVMSCSTITIGLPVHRFTVDRNARRTHRGIATYRADAIPPKWSEYHVEKGRSLSDAAYLRELGEGEDY